MEILFNLFGKILFGNINTLKKLITSSALLLLPFLGWLALYAASAADSSSNFYFVVSIGSFIAEFVLLIVVIIWRIQEVSAQHQITQWQPEDAYTIINQLRASGKLASADNPLIMADWEGVCLQGADLHDANLNNIGLETADLRRTNLSRANLRSARLESANLSECDLTGAILCYTRLQNANLRDAQLVKADFTAADLSHALLEGAHIDGARFDTHTTLPNGEKWTRHTDWSQFGVCE